jgi:hypothetical protein
VSQFGGASGCQLTNNCRHYRQLTTTKDRDWSNRVWRGRGRGLRYLFEVQVQKAARIDVAWYDANGDEVLCLRCRLTVLGVLGAVASIIGAITYMMAHWKR